MKLFFKNHGKLILIAFVLGALVPFLTQPKNLQSSVLNYGSFDSTEESIVAFHLKMNEITNLFIEDLVSAEAPTDLSFPDNPEEGCLTQNRSTYCLGFRLNEELTAFEMDLLNRRDDVVVDTDFEANTQIRDAVEQVTINQNLIEDEVQAARLALELNLAVYNQIQNVYPMHEQLLTLRGNLEEYRDRLAAIRDIVELYPTRFNDATTIFCQ